MNEDANLCALKATNVRLLQLYRMHTRVNPTIQQFNNCWIIIRKKFGDVKIKTTPFRSVDVVSVCTRHSIRCGQGWVVVEIAEAMNEFLQQAQEWINTQLVLGGASVWCTLEIPTLSRWWLVCDWVVGFWSWRVNVAHCWVHGKDGCCCTDASWLLHYVWREMCASSEALYQRCADCVFPGVRLSY